MISAANVFVKYGDRVLFDYLNLVINNSDKIGLVGRNGAGKSTLLRILAGMQLADSGQISRASGRSLSFLEQEMDLPKGKSVLEETMTAFEEVMRLEKMIDELNEQIATRTDYESNEYTRLLNELSDSTERYQFLGGDSVQVEAEKVLLGLGFKLEEFSRPTETFSGGWQMRIELAKMLLRKPDYLFLDEPTNHLDIESIIWLENYLKRFSGVILIISHDRQFLDNITNRTVEIERGKVFDYKAAFSRYLELRAERREKLEAAYVNQQKVISQKERTITRFMAKASKTSMAQSMKKQLDKIERIELDEADNSAMRIKFPPAPRSGQVVVETKALQKKYGDLLVLEGVDLKIDRGERVAFVGQNGQGKTTLAKMLVNELEHTAGTIQHGHNVQIGYYAQNQADALKSNLTLIEVMEQEAPADLRPKVRSILGAFMFSGEDAEKKVSVLSGGERARLALATMLLHPFNLLVLDEPTNHLDMMSKEVLKKALLDFDGTLIVVSHDRQFLAGLTTTTLEFRDKKLYHYIGDVNAFLEKRQVSDMREVEKRSQNSQSAGAAMDGEGGTSSLKKNRELRKKLQRTLQSAERKVEKLEEKIARFEAEMAKPDFYDSPNVQKTIEQYQSSKKELELVMEEWEEAHMEWEEYEKD